MDANTVIKQCRIYNNDGRYFGGGIFFGQENVNSQSTPVVDSCEITGNMVDQGGGGVYAVHALPLIKNSIIAGNTADYAGAVFGSHAQISLERCIIYGNRVQKSTVALGCVEGGADYRGKLLINHCTVVNNRSDADTSLGVSAVSLSKTCSSNVVINSIFWNNSGDFMNDSAKVTVSYSAIQGGCQGDSIITADPLLDTVSYALLPGSPCSNKASDGADIGAVETVLRRSIRLSHTFNTGFIPGIRPQIFCAGQHLFPPMCR